MGKIVTSDMLFCIASICYFTIVTVHIKSELYNDQFQNNRFNALWVLSVLLILLYGISNRIFLLGIIGYLVISYIIVVLGKNRIKDLIFSLVLFFPLLIWYTINKIQEDCFIISKAVKIGYSYLFSVLLTFLGVQVCAILSNGTYISNRIKLLLKIILIEMGFLFVLLNLFYIRLELISLAQRISVYLSSFLVIFLNSLFVKNIKY